MAGRDQQMALRDWVKDWLLRKRGAILSRPPGQFNLIPYKLEAARDRGLTIRSIVDGGASEGYWAVAVRTVWPDARLLLVEPRDDVQPQLQRNAAQLGNAQVAPVLLGPAEGEADFYIHGDWSSTSREFAQSDGTSKRTPVVPLDVLVERTNFGLPDLIKLDLQGAELSALEGATRCLAHATAVVCEVSFMQFAPGMPLIGDVMSFMAGRGFVAYDLIGLLHRPLDGALAQADVLFLRADNPLRAGVQKMSAAELGNS
jgi:FkbM family methyltransferase